MADKAKPKEELEKLASKDFIRSIIVEDLKKDKRGGKVHTRFPPEPNGYLHIGHAKSINLNFGIANEFGGKCNLRFDDTNPTKEEIEYVKSIQEDVKWLGYDWEDRLFYASDYFDKLYEFALQLIKAGKAYVCSLNAEQIREYRGTLKEAGKESPYRSRPVDENLELFEKMKNGEFEEGECVLRAKIDMTSPNLNMRDPVIYRIMKREHHRTGDKWNIYPMYDFAHGLSDYLEGVSHSVCTLEFEDHRPLYEWFLDELELEDQPQQIEFARLNLSYTVMSKRKLLELVNDKIVSGWDDPRMPTLSAYRRRGYTPESIRNFCDEIGVAKRNNTIDVALIEHSVREDLNKKAQRVMAVLDPVKVVITNYPEGETEMLEAVNNPEDETMGTREVPFSRELYIERDDFMIDPPKKFFRLSPGREVRLRYAYFVKCVDYKTDNQTGEVSEIHCTYDPETKGGSALDGRKVKATLHWVSKTDALRFEARLYDRLFEEEDPLDVEEDTDWKDSLNPASLEVRDNCYIEPFVRDMKPQDKVQFERLGYFCVDKDSTKEKLVFNRTVPLRDSWKKIQKQKQNQKKQKKKKK